MSDFSAQFQKIHLLVWTDAKRREYTERYFQFRHLAQDASTAIHTNQKIDQSPKLREMCQIPLRLNMTLELITDHEKTDLRFVEDSLALYHAYIHNWLTREASKLGSVLGVDEKFKALEEIAWHFYDEGTIGENTSARFTRDEMVRLFGSMHLVDSFSAEDIVNDLCAYTLLQVQTAWRASGEPTVVRFIHKSFHEYFVARYLFNCMCKDVNTAANAFRRIISPEVSEFLKEYVKRINKDTRLLAIVSEICIGAFKANRETSHGEDVSPARARIARQQLAYYLGNMTSTKVVEFLKHQLSEEVDLWIQRGMAIGLAFGGHAEHYHSYIDRLRTERAIGGASPENDVNIGFHLSFFGDQPFDELNPDKDQGLPTCESTLRKLIYQLGTEIDRGSWRLNLYTIRDLGSHRETSKTSFIETMTKHLSEFERIVSKLRSDSQCSWWPEIGEAQSLINALKNAADIEARPNIDSPKEC